MRKENRSRAYIRYALFLLVLCAVSISIAFSINEVYKVGEGYITLWKASDVLSFYGAYLSFLGSVVLGMVAVYQNKKVHQLNEQMQKLQQAQFFSMVSVIYLEINKRSIETPHFFNKNIGEYEVVNLMLEGVHEVDCYHIDIIFKNDSQFPIVEMLSCIKEGGSSAKRKRGQAKSGITVYIPTCGEKAIRFIVPYEDSGEGNEHQTTLNIDFINIFDYKTAATIHLSDLENENLDNKYSFRLSKLVSGTKQD